MKKLLGTKIQTACLAAFATQAIVACGEAKAPPKAAETAKPIKATNYGLSDREQKIRDLSVDLKIPVTIDPKLGTDDEFYVNHALRVLDRNRAKVRALGAHVHGIVLSNEFGVTESGKGQGIARVDVRASAADLLEYLETGSRDYGRTHALSLFQERLRLAVPPRDLIGLESRDLEALLPRLETALKGVDLKLSKMGLILAEHNAVILPTKEEGGSFVVDIRASAQDLSVFLTRGLAQVTKASALLASPRSFSVSIQPGVFGVEELESALGLLESLDRDGKLKGLGRDLKELTLGRRFESSSASDAAAPLRMTIDARATPAAVVEFVRSAPPTFAEREAALLKALGAPIPNNPEFSKLELSFWNVQRAYATYDKVEAIIPGLRSALTPDLIKGLQIRRLRILDNSDRHEISDGTLRVALKEPIANLGPYLGRILRDGLERRRREQLAKDCAAAVSRLRGDVATRLEFPSAYCENEEALPVVERLHGELRTALADPVYKALDIDLVKVTIVGSQEPSFEGFTLNVPLRTAEAAKILEAAKAETERRAQVVKERTAAEYERLRAALSTPQRKIDILDKSGLKWSLRNISKLSDVVSAVLNAIDARDAAKLGLRRFEISASGYKATWVAAEKKLVVPYDVSYSGTVREAVESVLQPSQP